MSSGSLHNPLTAKRSIDPLAKHTGAFVVHPVVEWLAGVLEGAHGRVVLALADVGGRDPHLVARLGAPRHLLALIHESFSSKDVHVSSPN